MTLKRMLLIFFAAFYSIMFVAAVIGKYFDFNIPGSVQIWIVGGVVFFSCTSFGKKNKRLFTGCEKFIAATTIIFVVFTFRTFVETLIYKAKNETQVGFTFAVSFMSIIDVLVIFISIWLAKRSLKKELKIAS